MVEVRSASVDREGLREVVKDAEEDMGGVGRSSRREEEEEEDGWGFDRCC
jgi:hypothetical protein